MTALPFVSVLVPVRNEERYIERCLYSLAAQDYPRDRFEVLVIDGESTDATAEIVARFAAESTLELRHLSNPRRLPAAALNLGLDAARGEVVIRLDGHAAAAHDFISRSVEALETSGADCAGGPITSEGDTFVGRAIALAMASRFGVGGAAFRTGGAGAVDTVAFGAYRQQVFERIGRFSEDIPHGEDDEFNYRLRDAGGTIVLVPAIHTRYTVRGDLISLWRQYYGYGRAKPEVLRRHPAQARPRQLAPAALVLALGAGVGRATSGRSGGLRAVCGLYGLGVAGASIAIAARKDPRHAVVLPAVFACLHLSYGAGFLAGVAELAERARGAASRPSGAHSGTEAST